MKHLKLIFISLLCLLPQLRSADLIINAPGIYTLNHDIISNPSSGNDSIVIIESDDVILDLARHTIRLDPLNTQPDIKGIIIDDGLSNILIKNGTISHVTGTGIFISKGSSRITLENLKTYSCDNGGIVGLGDINLPIIDLMIKSCDVSACAQFAQPLITGPVYWLYCNQSQMSNCRVHHNVNLLTNMGAIFIEECSNCNFSNIKSQYNRGVFSLAGFALLNNRDNYFSHCLSADNVALATTENFSLGFVLFGGNTFQRVTFDHCIARQNNGGDMAVGFLDSDQSQEVTFLNCLSLQHSGTHLGAGFVTNGTRNNFINCIAEGNNTLMELDNRSLGFFLNTAIECSVIDCLAKEQRGLVAVGFDFSNCNRCQIKNNTALLNIGSEDANSFGFRINGPSGFPDTGNNKFINNNASQNGSIANNQMNNFIAGTYSNISYASLNSVTIPFTNLGIVD